VRPKEPDGCRTTSGRSRNGENDSFRTNTKIAASIEKTSQPTFKKDAVPRVVGADRQELVEGHNGLTGLFSKSYSRLDFDHNTTPNQS
jgi:hypothetical protein